MTAFGSFSLVTMLENGGQESVEDLGNIPPPITQEGPKSVPGEKDLTQDFSGPLTDETYKTRGYHGPSKVSA